MECRWEHQELICKKAASPRYIDLELPVNGESTGFTVQTTPTGDIKITKENGSF